MGVAGKMPAYLNFAGQDRGLAPADNLKRREAVVADDSKMSIGSFREFFGWMGLEPEE